MPVDNRSSKRASFPTVLVANVAHRSDQRRRLDVDVGKTAKEFRRVLFRRRRGDTVKPLRVDERTELKKKKYTCI